MSATLAPPSLAADRAAVPAQRHHVTGALLVASAGLAAAGAIILSVTFGWPDVLDEGAAVALPAFAAQEGWVTYGFLLELVSSVLLVLAAIGLAAAVGRGDVLTRSITVFGIAGALFQILGWVRWPLVVPGLAERYLDPTTDETTRISVGTTYDLLNAYAGGALGEHLGWLFQCVWAIGVAVLVARAVGLPAWFGWFGLISAVAWTMLIVPEPYVDALSSDAVSFVAFNVYTVWFVWVLVLGVLLALRRIAPGGDRRADR